MNTATLRKTLALGAITGMRSMSGPAVVALRHGPIVQAVAGLLAAGEMVADKTDLVGDRIDALPLAGRALMGAVVGGAIAREGHASVLAGGVIGASVAVIAAHFAYRLRTRFANSSAVGGVLEDALVIGIGALYSPRVR